MERPKSRDDVAVFVDFENVYVSVREKFDAQPNFELIMDRCEDYGRIVIARAYADWYRYPRVTSALFANGVEPMYVPTYYYDREVGRTGRPIKNSVDIHLCIDAMRTLYTQTHIDKFVLVTGDRDFIPLVNAIRQHGKEVIIIGIGGAASAHLAQSGDEFLFYEQIADLKGAQPQRQEQQPARAEKRDRSDRGERTDRPERERSDGNGKVDGRRDRDRSDRDKQPERREPTPEPVAAAVPERSVYDTLVDAINLARQRGFVSNLGSLKVLMRELDSSFNESKVKDSNGRPFSKFKDFVKEAERQGKVQIFTNGTVTEVFLPGEDPMHVSQFAEDLASDQVERELETELEQEEAQRVPQLEQVEPIAAPVEDIEVAEDVTQPVLPGVPETLVEPTPVAKEAEPQDEIEADDQAPERAAPATFGERDWQIFRGSMSQFTDPVRFAEIFSALRGLRNQEVFDLTNNELKELVKQAINRGMLQRTGRGARAYYRISSQYRVAQDDVRTPIAASNADNALVGTALADEPVEESAAGQVSDAGLAPALRRRGRVYGSASAAPVATSDTPAASGTESTAQLADTVADQMAVQTADEPAPTKTRRNRRKKPASTPEAPAATAEVEAEADAEPDQASSEAGNDQKTTNGTKKRRTRRKKPATKAGDNGADAGEGAE